MAISNEFIAIVIAVGICFFMSTQKKRLTRLMGLIGMIVFGLSLVLVGTEIPMYIMMLACVLYAGPILLEEITEVTR